MIDATTRQLGSGLTHHPRKTSLVMVATIVFVDMLGVGLAMPVMPSLIVEITDFSLNQSAKMSGFLLLAYALMQFIFAPLIGALSDRFGRRPILLVTMLALGLNYFFMAFATTLLLIGVGRIISGIMGATFAAANSCVADTVTPEARGAAFGTLAAAGAAGLIFGPALGGVAGEFGTRLPFLIAGALALSTSFTGYFILKETLTQPKRRPFGMARANPFGVLIHVAKNKFILGCLVAVFFLQLSAQAHLSIWAFYGAQKFGWSPWVSGITVSFYGILLVAAQGVLTGRAIAKFGASETVKYSILFAIPSYVLIALAPNTNMLVLGVSLGTITGMTYPALQSIMTMSVEESDQGELQGALACTIGLTSIIGPILMTHVFAHFSDSQGLYFPGAPFMLATGLVMIAAISLWQALTRLNPKPTAASAS
jgi:MFS transporter, DHA1 family, tetracycline resistance protein